MASIDWQTSLSTTFKLISTSILHLLTGLYWLTLWIVLNVAASAPRYILKTASVILTPLTYLLYQVWRVFAFLSSPIQAFGRVILGMGGLIIGFIVKFKVQQKNKSPEPVQVSDHANLWAVSVYLCTWQSVRP